MTFRKSVLIPLALIVITIFILLCEYARLFFDVPLVDETLYVGAALLTSLGAKPFYNELFVTQTASLLYEPIVALYYALFGKFAIMLFIRHVFFVALIAAGAGTFYYCRKKFSTGMALALALIIVTGTNFGSPSLSYNSIGTLSYGCFALFALRAVNEQSKRLALLAGVFGFLAMAAYPTMLAGFVALNLLIALVNWRLSRTWLPILLRIDIIAGVLLLSFVASLVLRFGWDNMYLSYEFTAAHVEGGPFWPKMAYGWMLFTAFAPWPWLIATLFTLWFVLWKKWNASYYLFLIPIGVCLALELKTRPENGTWAQTLDLIGLLGGSVFVINAWREDLANNWMEIVLWGTSLLLVPVICWTSGMTYYSTHYSSLYGLLAVLMLAHRNMKWRYLPILALSVPLIFIYQTWESSLKDDDLNVSRLTEMIDWGAYAGVWTYPAQFKYLKQMQADIDASSSQARSILFYDTWPAGYMMSDLFPATREWLIHSLGLSSRVRPLLREYYTDPANRPDVIFRFTRHQTMEGSVDAMPTRYLPYKDVFWYYLPEETGDYREFIKRDFYSVYKKKSLL